MLKQTVVVLSLMLVSAGAAAQQSDVVAVVELGGLNSSCGELGGDEAAIKVGYTRAGVVDHYVSFRATAAHGALELVCWASVQEGALLSLSYEPRLSLSILSDRVRPYVGGQIGAARGWDGAGAVIGVNYGIQAVVLERLVLEIGGATRHFRLRPAGPHGKQLAYTIPGFHLDVGWRF